MSSAVITSALPVFEALRLIANSNEPLSTADLARSMNLPTSTVHRFLGTLEQSGYIRRYMRSVKFIPGSMPQHLCRALFNRFPLSRVAPPFLQQIAALSHATVTLMVRIGWFGLRIETTGDATSVSEIAGCGALAPLHAALEGQAILAFVSETELEGYQRYLRRRAGAIAGPRARFRSDLEAFRDMGFLVGPPLAFAADRAAAALPVRDRAGEPVAAIGVIGPAVEAGLRRMTEPVRAWIEVRAALEAELARDPAGTVGPFTHLDLGAILPGASGQGTSGQGGR